MAEQYIDFLNEASGSPFAASLAVQRRLIEAGYVQLKENEMWKLEQHKKYFIVRDQISVVAFRTNAATETSRFMGSGSHLDSPYLRVKPNPTKYSEDLASITCETYGGAIWNTWIDRDLGISGRVILKDGSAKVFTIKEPLMKIPGLAIHLDTERKYIVNKENHLPALCCEAQGKRVKPMELIYERIAEKLQIDKKDIVGSDIMLCDIQPASFMTNKRYIVGQGQDNLHGAYTSLIGFLNAEETNKDLEQIDFYVSFDHEEIGSSSRRGANSVFAPEIFRRIHASLFESSHPQAFAIAKSKSVILSVDGAHASHPTIDLIEKNHPIRLNGGPVLKNDSSQRYMSDGFLRACVAKATDVQFQVYVLRQDLTGGSTIGPLISVFSGMNVIDMGTPMLSMHSIRECTGAKDVELMIKLVQDCYAKFPEMTN